MLVGTVIGQVWATQKDATLSGLRFLVVAPYVTDGSTPETVVAVDTIGAGTGERVLVVFGRAARHAIGRGQDIGFQTAIVAIVDGMELSVRGRRARVGQVAEQDTET
jgi:ethanolamine utilization protein EutN